MLLAGDFFTLFTQPRSQIQVICGEAGKLYSVLNAQFYLFPVPTPVSRWTNIARR